MYAHRATAAEMGLRAIKRFQRRQEYFRQVLLAIYGRVGPRVDVGLTVQFEELMPSGMDREGAAAKALPRPFERAPHSGRVGRVRPPCCRRTGRYDGPRLTWWRCL